MTNLQTPIINYKGYWEIFGGPKNCDQFFLESGDSTIGKQSVFWRNSISYEWNDNACKNAPVQITARAIIVCMKRVKVKAIILVYVFLRSRKLVINKNSMLVFEQYNILLLI